MIIGFTGSQKGMTTDQFDRVVLLLRDLAPTEVHHGDCVGADWIFHTICMTMQIPVVLHPPIKDNKRAGCEGYAKILPAKEYLVRNRDIVDASDELIAVPDTTNEKLRSGTWSTYRYAKNLGKTTHLVKP